MSNGVIANNHSPPVVFAVRELCYRCKRPVYPTDKIGPLKDGTFFHHGCFKCYICGTRLSLKTYCNNRNNTEDQEIYCSSHVPLAGPHDPIPHRSNLLHSPGSQSHTQLQNGSDRSLGTPKEVGDIWIQHALKATEIHKPYPKITHAGARYAVDYDQQTRLELIHREQEDDLYKKFAEQRSREEQRFTEETKEEWERALSEITKKYDARKSQEAREQVINHLTLKREKQRETMRQAWRERERALTADLVDKQSKEMIDLFRQVRKPENGELPNGSSNGATNGHHTASTNGNGVVNGNGQTHSLGGHSPGSYPPTPPPPFPPVGRKRDLYTDPRIFEAVDQTAISVAQAEQQTFTDLVRALTHNCKSDVEIARSIYRWITVKNLNVMEFDHRLDPNTPMGILRGIKFGTESYHVLFKRLCSYAGLHCVVIKGFSKSAGYQPGMHFDDSRFRNTWNGVFLGGSWRFVQCNWGARHLVNAKDVPQPNARMMGKSENLRYEYDDHYFMTDPEEFVHEFFPQNAEWQLLKRPLTLQEFEELPFVRSLFFRYGLTFADPHLKAVVFADKTGAATVAINMSPEAITSLIFHYNLRAYDSDDQELHGVSLKRFVMQSVVGYSIVFRVHTPARGEYLLDIFANSISPGEYLTGQPMKFKSVCKFKVVCDYLNVIMVPLPECASGEWGPAKAFRLFGMIPLTHEDAIINSGLDLEIRFRMQRPLPEFVAALHKNMTDDKRLQKHAAYQIKGDVVSFKLQFTEEGQYGLDIYTRDRMATGEKEKDRQLLTHCCKYLVNART